MLDYRKRYQSIKDKGQELGITITQIIKKEKMLYFENSYYANFSTIPLEDYLSLKVFDAKNNDYEENIVYFNFLSLGMDSIRLLEDNSPFRDIRFRIKTKLEAEDTKKEREHPIYYLPIELSLLFNTHNEDTIEETLTRYLFTLFKPKHTTKEQLLQLVKKDFEKYALILNLHFGSGYLISDAPLEFEDLIVLEYNRKQTSLKVLLEEGEDQKRNILSCVNNEDLFTPTTPKPFNSNSKNIEAPFDKEAIIFITNLLNNLPEQTPSKKIFDKYITPYNSGRFNYIYLTLTILISNKKVCSEIKNQIKEIKKICKDITLPPYKQAYDRLYKSKKAPKVSTATIISEKKEDNTPLPIYYPTGEPSIEIIFKAIQQYSPVKDSKELDYIANYRNDYLKRESIKQEINNIKRELSNEQTENGYNTQTARDLENTLRERIQILNILNEAIEEGGNTFGIAPTGYFLLGERAYKGFSREASTYQVSLTESVIVVSENTQLRASNDTLSKYNDITNKILAFIMAMAVKNNSYDFNISNEEEERIILADRYSSCSGKDRDNARQSFIEAVVLLSRTTLETSYNPSETSKRKGYKPRRRGGGSILSYTNYKNYVNIKIDSNIFAIAIKDFPIIPTSSDIYKLTPSAFLTAIYLYSHCAFNHTNKLIRSFDSLIDNNPSYQFNLKHLKDNPSRLFTPILMDMEEMRNRGIIKNYTPTLKEYEKIRLKTEDMITIIFNLKPQKKHK